MNRSWSDGQNDLSLQNTVDTEGKSCSPCVEGGREGESEEVGDIQSPINSSAQGEVFQAGVGKRLPVFLGEGEGPW